MDNIRQFWNDFCVVTQKEGAQYKDSFQFGVIICLGLIFQFLVTTKVSSI